MPFKSDKITYGIPTDEFDGDKVKNYIKDLKKTIGLERDVVGVKFFFDKEEYENCPIPVINGKVSHCIMVERATRGHSCKSTLENHGCDGGTTALGLEKSTHEIESGQVYFSYNLYATNAVARRMRKSVMGLHREEADTYGMLVQPLEDFNSVPDVVIIIGNAYHSMRLMQGYVYNTGVKPNLDYKAMQAICSECTTVPYMTGEMNISALCPSTRLLCKWDDGELAVGLPYEKFEETVKGVMGTSMA